MDIDVIYSNAQDIVFTSNIKIILFCEPSYKRNLKTESLKQKQHPRVRILLDYIYFFLCLLRLSYFNELF
jgi:hypothetical protein